MATYTLGDVKNPLAPFAGAAGRQTITGLSTAKQLTVPKRARGAMIQAVTQGVRFTMNGDTPTGGAGGGFPLAAGDVLIFYGNLDALKFIEQTASATLDVHYLR